MIRAIILACAFMLAMPMLTRAMPEGYPSPSPKAKAEQASEPVDPVLEKRARAIGKKLRCVVCQNQSIDESDATLAADMRQLVLERLQQGDTDQQVIEYIRSRYGDFVLMKPPVKRDTWALWGGPIAFLIIGAAIFAVTARRRKPADLAGHGQSDDAIADILKKYED